MKIQKCITFTSALLLLAVVPSLAQEQLFEIRNRSYGNANAFPGVQDEIDALFDIMETSINDLLPTLDTTKYMKGMANAGRTSLAGIGTDYTSPFKWFLIGFNAGASIDLGDIAVSQILNRTASVADFGGFGPAAGFWHGLLGECEFRERKLSKLCLHPLDLGFGLPRSQRGRPLLARGEVARETLERVQRLSLRYGTKINIEGETGVVSLG